jgi:hypothetical protein
MERRPPLPLEAESGEVKRGEHGGRSRALGGHAGVAGAGGCEGEEIEGGALEGQREEPEKDWVSAESIGGEIAFEGGRVQLALGLARVRGLGNWSQTKANRKEGPARFRKGSA